MSVGYSGIQWNRQKRRYDAAFVAIVALALAAWTGVSLLLRPEITVETLVIRGSAVVAFALLHAILCIGPLARLDPRFLPLLYNRRHLGVTMFLLALVHAAVSTVQFHAQGDVNPLVSVFTAYRRDYGSLAHFPFEPLGALALGILFLMAATSHDFWLKNLGASVWKTLHLGVFVAWGLLVAHVAYGALQSERSPLYPVLLGAGVAAVLGLHLAAARREARVDRREVGACNVRDLVEDVGRTIVAGGRRVALYRTKGRVYALANVCRHQGGPLGEGRIVDGCVTCPWHGWTYRPEDGTSPPPFEERVETHRVRVEGGSVWVDPTPSPPGTLQAGAAVTAPVPGDGADEFYIGYLASAPPGLARRLARIVALVAVAAPALAAALAAAQGELPSGTFEFGTLRNFEGVLYETPVPLLRVTRSGAAASLLLVGAGKHGLPAVALGQSGRKVHFAGRLIHRENLAMIEITRPDGFAVVGAPAPGEERGRAEIVGPVDLTGELVDTKCWLGVMRPASGKVHRGCAARCLAGGVPPGLLVRDNQGGATVFLLAPSDDAEPLGIDPQLAGRTLRVTGRLEIHDGVGVVRVAHLPLPAGLTRMGRPLGMDPSAGRGADGPI